VTILDTPGTQTAPDTGTPGTGAPVTAAPSADAAAGAALGSELLGAGSEGRGPTDTRQPLNPLTIGGASFLAVAAAGWMFAGVFTGFFAHIVVVMGAALGVGIVTYSYRTTRPAMVQYLAGPVVVAAGAALVLPFLNGGSANLINLVMDSLRNGGIAHPPLPFDPGWRFILFVVVAMLGMASTTLSMITRRPKIGVTLPGPLVLAGALLQPNGASLTSAAVPLVMFVGAFGVAYGADLAKEGASSTRFELRRLARLGGLLAGLVGVVVVLSLTGFLLPPDSPNQPVIPPQFPQTPPPQPDRPLFSVTMSQHQPLRLGVLDVYGKNAWLTPPFDESRFEDLPNTGAVTAGHASGELPALPPPADKAAPQTIQFKVKDIGGHLLPDIANPLRVPHQGFKLQYDPRTQALRLPEEPARSGWTYSEIAPAIPTGTEMSSAGPPPATMKEYLQTPPAPPAVQNLLKSAPTSNSFLRLQYVRNAYYKKVVAAGAGSPVHVPPARVDSLLAGNPGTPFEIVAGEALLARWAGVPARVGYGYYSTTPDKPGSNVYSIRPIDGAVWLEAYFNHYGWVPIVGTPPKAQASLSTDPKKHNPNVIPSDRLDLRVYVMVRHTNAKQLYDILRFWLVRVFPVALAVVLAVLFYPGLVKLARRRKRRRWARPLGFTARIAVAYSELRDVAYDLNLGDVTLTPLEFVAAGAEDAEHRELAWLVTRALWADLARDLQPQDVEHAEDMASSVLRRMRSATPFFNRLVGFGSRTSLRDPYSTQIPNLWPNWRPVRRIGMILRRVLVGLNPRSLLRGLRRLPRVLPRAAASVLLVMGIGGCVQQVNASGPAGRLPGKFLPASVSGITFREEPTAESAYGHVSGVITQPGKVYSIYKGGVIQGDLQAAVFLNPFSARLHKVKTQVLRDVGARNFQLTRVGTQKLYVAHLSNELVMVWFAPDGSYYELMDASQAFAQAEALFVSLLSYQQGGTTNINNTTGVAPPDPRSGSDYF
jgi:hypothetical protein